MVPTQAALVSESGSYGWLGIEKLRKNLVIGDGEGVRTCPDGNRRTLKTYDERQDLQTVDCVVYADR